MRKKYFIILAFIFTAGIITTACAVSSSSVRRTNTAQETETAKSPKDIGIIINVDDANGNITLGSVGEDGKTIYSYNSGTTAYTKSGNVMSMAQLAPGDIVDITYDPDSCILQEIRISDDEDVWENSKVTVFSVDETSYSMKIGQTLYSYSDNTYVFSDGERIDITELNSEDQLIVRGYGTKVCSVVVDKGHGYVTLSGEQLFIGGYVDIGGRVVKVIQDDMLIIVREGSYKVEVRNGEYVADKQVQVTRNEETVVDFSDVAPIVTETGNIRFNIDVEDAVLYVDGVQMAAGEVLTITSGTHSIKVTAEGYDDYTDTVEVGTGYQIVDITLNESSEDESENQTEAESTTSADEEVTDSSGNVVSRINDVTVSGPEGGYVYFDGKYMGTAPVTFDLVTGSHVISILYNNEINSYTVNLAEGGDDVTYDFTDR